ncbi:MAG: PilZ domain-containing protein [Kiloniellaceae bacterium]
MSRSNMTVMRKERRRDRRRAMQLEASLGGQQVVLTDLSAAGFGAAVDATDRRPQDFRVGQRLQLDLRWSGGNSLSLAVEITREIGENGIVGGVFIGISDETYDLVESLLTGRASRRR